LSKGLEAIADIAYAIRHGFFRGRLNRAFYARHGKPYALPELLTLRLTERAHAEGYSGSRGFA